MKKFYGLIIVIIFAAVLPACAAPPQPTPTATLAAPVATELPTATIDWFPATATPTRLPTMPPEPTPQMKPGIGEVLIENLLSTTGKWTSGTYSAGNITWDQTSLTLAVQQPKSSLLSLELQKPLEDFYLETSVNISLCKAGDVVGLTVRSQSNINYYRFLVDCDGNARAERVRNGTTTLMQDWVPSGILPGAPQHVVLGVWVLGKEMRFFANDVHVLTVQDPVFTSGTIGVFARSAGDTPVTVRFEDMQVRAIEALSEGD